MDETDSMALWIIDWEASYDSSFERCILAKSSSLGESSESTGGGLDADRDEPSDEIDSVELTSSEWMNAPIIYFWGELI